MVAAWLLFPLLFIAVTLGAGLLIDRAVRQQLPGVLLIPLGMANVVVVSQITTYADATAGLTTPILVAMSAAGLLLGRHRLRVRDVDAGAVLVGVSVFAMFAAPVVCSGQATFAGYGVLGDTAVHFVLIDHVLHHGHSLAGLTQSSYREAVDNYLSTAYPIGSHTALGAVRSLVGQDVAWVFQPYICLLASLTALVLYSLVLPHVKSRMLCVLIAVIAAQPGLVYAYALQGSIKELATVWVIALLVALLPSVTGATHLGLRQTMPLAVATAAALGILSVSVAPWLGPILLLWLVGVIRTRTSGSSMQALRIAGFFGIAVAALSFPAALVLGDFVERTTGTVTSQAEFGNLLGALRWEQMFGVWPRGDFRLPLGDVAGVGYALIGVTSVSIVIAVFWIVRVRATGPLVLAAVSFIGWWYVTQRGSPWADAKALMILSPAVVLLGMLGGAALIDGGHRGEGWLLAACIAAGIVWTNALAYHDASLAPRDRMRELELIGHKFAGEGPTFYPQFEEYAKHFLREMEPSSPGENAMGLRPVLRRGVERKFGASYDVDEFGIRYLQRFRTIVMRRSPDLSRPPASYRRTFAGKYYDVWTRDFRTRVAHHFALGGPDDPGGVAPCRTVRMMAVDARRNGRWLAYVGRAKVWRFDPARQALPPRWGLDTDDAEIVHPIGAGRLTGSVRVPAAGRFNVWLRGSIGRGIAVIIDGKIIGTVSGELGPTSQYLSAGQVALKSGRSRITLLRGGGDLAPGNGGDMRSIGPLLLASRDAPDRFVGGVSPRNWRDLCGRRLDWIETVSAE